VRQQILRLCQYWPLLTHHTSSGSTTVPHNVSHYKSTIHCQKLQHYHTVSIHVPTKLSVWIIIQKATMTEPVFIILQDISFSTVSDYNTF
jgi:hypothetical protein